MPSLNEQVPVSERARELLASMRGPSATASHIRHGDPDRVVDIDVAIRAMVAFAAPQPTVSPATDAREALVEAAQRLQDHMEQHHGVTLNASEWDAAVAAALSTEPTRSQEGGREAIARLVKGARFVGAFGREFRAGDGRLDDVDLDAADAILSLVGSKPERTDTDEIARPRCGCPSETARRVIVDHGVCGKGGCPYGGDL